MRVIPFYVTLIEFPRDSGVVAAFLFLVSIVCRKCLGFITCSLVHELKSLEV